MNPTNNNYRTRPRYYVCEKCGKKLIHRGENGLWHFSYGKKKDDDGKLIGTPSVEMFVYGSIKMRCIDRDCEHWNTLDFFPFRFLEKSEESS